jgi:signal transduction histidine kinase
MTSYPRDAQTELGDRSRGISTPRSDDPLYAVPDESLDRVERVIAVSRAVLSICALGVQFLDPRRPMYSTTALYVVLVAYIAYSAGLLWLFTNRGMRSRTTSRPILLADIGWFTLIVGLSEGSSSPFFLFYLFAVCTAAIRWGIRTTLRIAVLSGGLYLLAVLVVRRIVLGPEFSMHSAHLMRPTYLILLGYLVGFIGEHELSAKRRLIEMVTLQREVAGRSRSALVTLARVLLHVARFFGADYVLLQLRVPDSPALEWEGSRHPGRRLFVRNVPPTPWSEAAAGTRSYRVSHAIGNWGRRVESFAPGSLRALRLTDPDEPGFLSRSRTRSLISVPIRSPGGVRGRLLLGRLQENFAREDLDFCLTLVTQAGMILDNVSLQAKAEELAVAEERARIARDVHDGFVQSLASLDVGIEVCRRLERKQPARLASELAELQRTVKQGYRDARRYLDRLRDQRPHGPDVDQAVRELVREFRERAEVAVELDAHAEGVPARHGIGYEILQIVREGLTNIVRHSGAKHAAILLDARNGEIHVCIRDDGRGFPAAATAEASELPRTAAPWSIRERVEALGGTLKLSSKVGGGSEIRITLPRTESA